LDTDARFATDGRYVFYPDEDEAMGLFVIDVTDPTQPKEVARALTPFYPYAAAVDRGVVYVATEERAILALDATSPVGLHEVGRTPGWDAANAVAASRGRMYVAAGNTGLVTLDATQLPLTEVGRLDTLGFMRSLAVSGDRAYLLNASSLTVADISDAGLNVRGQVYLPKYGRGLEVAGDYVYVADHSAGLVIVDVSDPSRPYIAGSIAKPRRAYGVAAKGNIVYGCSYETSSRRYAVFAFDVSDPSRPQVLDSCGVWRRAYDVALKDTFLYVACGTNGCQVVSVSDPAHPQPVAGFGTRDYRQLCVRGQYLFAAGDETGLQVFDLSSPASPELVAQYDTPGSALGVCVQGHYVYLADGPAGALMLGLNLVWARTDTVTRPALRVLENPTRQTQLAGVLELVEAADITLAVYSAAGRRVAGEHLVAAGPGRHHFHLNLAGVPAGAYFLRATGAARLPTVKFVLAR